MISADVVEVDVEPVGESSGQLLGQLAVLVVEGVVEAQRLDGVADLVLGSSAANHARGSGESGELARESPDRAAGRRNENRLARRERRNVEQPGVRRQARHAEYTEVVRPRVSARL